MHNYIILFGKIPHDATLRSHCLPRRHYQHDRSQRRRHSYAGCRTTGSGGAGPDAGCRDLAESLLQLPSASLSFDHLLECLRWAEAKVDAGAVGVVLTQGTDTLEETAFFLDLYWDRPQPLILTGAMRTPAAVSADGPGNLLAAVQTAIAPGSRGRGVLVVMNDTIHAARWVSKADALSLHAFVSPDGGAAGRLVEGRPGVFSRAGETAGDWPAASTYGTRSHGGSAVERRW